MNQSSSDEKENFMEDYFFSGTVEPPRSNQVYALIIYDIINNKKRTGFAKFMSGFGRRVQKSCFEVRISQKSFDKLLRQIGYYCDTDDNIRVYRINGRSEVYNWGRPVKVVEDPVVIL